MNDEELAGSEPEQSDLQGVPGLGPVRRRLLAEAGITTRVALAESTPEQLIAVTGMRRAAAETALAAIASARTPAAEPVLLPVPESSVVTELDAVTEPMGEETPQATRLEIAALRAQTVIADASRHTLPESKLAGVLARFARLADELPRRIPVNARPGVLRRVAERLETICARLETVTGKAEKEDSQLLPSKRAKRLQARIKRTRDTIKRTLKAAH